MLLTMFKSKIHRATVTQADLNYTGSLTLDPDLIEAAEMFPYERVQVLNVNTGARFETYIIPGERGTGTVCLNGPAARMGVVGDIILALTYCQVPVEEAKDWKPNVVHVDANNRVVAIDHDVS